MSYQKVEDQFYRSHDVLIKAKRIKNQVVFNASAETMDMIDNLSLAEKERLSDVVTVGGLLDPSE